MATDTFHSRFRVPFADARRPVKSLLIVDRPPSTEADGFVLEAITWIRTEYGSDARVAEVAKKLESDGGTDEVIKATAMLNSSALDRVERLLLSTPGVYATIIGVALDPATKDKPKLEDTAGLFNFIRRQLNDPETDSPRKKFVNRLVTTVITNNAIRVDDPVKNQVVKGLVSRELPLRSERAEPEILGVIQALLSIGGLADQVNAFIKDKTSGIAPTRFTESVKARMVAYLERVGIDSRSVGSMDPGVRENLLTMAYDQAIGPGNGGTTDPIDAVRQRGTVSDWDFTVDTFEGVEEQGVIPANILAAGALDYIYNLGEVLGMFRLADTVVLRWGSGAIDLDPGETSSRLYRYWKLRSERTSPEDRGMLYKRVLNKSDGEILEGAVVNERFPELWGALMQAVADYIERVEEKKTEENSVSRQRVYQATRQLQYNLTEFATGMAHMQINEMYHHLQEAREILEDPQIVDYFGSGRRKTIWTVIERGSKEWFETTPNIAAVRDAAVEGNKVFQWIARFDQASVTDQEFFAFKDAAEAWILAQASMGEAVPLAGPSDEEELTDEDEELVGPGKDEFDADWDQ